MKTKNSEIAVKIFLVVVAVILVGLLIAWSTGVFKDKKNDLSRSTEKINSAIGSMSEFDLLVYDGGTITGSLLLDLLENKPEGVNILYRTLADATVSPIPTPPTDYTNINPNGIFKGEVVRNEGNNVITQIIFTQQK